MSRQSKGHNFVVTNPDFVATKAMTKLCRDSKNPDFVATKLETNFVAKSQGQNFVATNPDFVTTKPEKELCRDKAKDIMLGIQNTDAATQNADVATPKMSRLKC